MGPQQEVFKKRVCAYLETTLGQPRKDGWQWCGITGAYYQGKRVKVAHIVPRKLEGQHAEFPMGRAECLCYESDEIDYEMIWGPRDGIPMHVEVAEAFDNGGIIIVPIKCDDDTAGLRFKTVVLDKTLLLKYNELCIAPSWGAERRFWTQIHGS